MLQVHPEEEKAEDEEETSEKRGADNLKLGSKQIKTEVKLMTKTKVNQLNPLILF